MMVEDLHHPCCIKVGTNIVVKVGLLVKKSWKLHCLR